MSDTSECRGHAKSEFHAAHRLGGVLLVWLLSCACSVHNLSYDQILRDLDATVEVEGSGDDERLVYRTEVEATWGIARWSLMAPFRWFLLPLFGERVDRELENPSAYVRELAGALPVKAGGRLERRAATAQRLVRIAELDPSPRNRIMALEGLAQLASAQGIALTDGLVEFGPKPALLDGAAAWRDAFAKFRPAARSPVGAALQEADDAAYRAAVAGLCSRPLATWRQRLALLSDLANAHADEQQAELREFARQSLELAFAHAARASVVAATQGRGPELREVRLCAIELLHRSAGADSVPLLLALIAASPEQIQSGEPQFEESDALRLRVIHLCGQLQGERALRTAKIAGREAWDEVAPAEFLVRMALDSDPFFSPTAIPAREALAFCIGRKNADPSPDSPDGEDWVASWWNDYRKQRTLP